MADSFYRKTLMWTSRNSLCLISLLNKLLVITSIYLFTSIYGISPLVSSLILSCLAVYEYERGRGKRYGSENVYKDVSSRLAWRKGASEIQRHLFFLSSFISKVIKSWNSLCSNFYLKGKGQKKQNGERESCKGSTMKEEWEEKSQHSTDQEIKLIFQNRWVS